MPTNRLCGECGKPLAADGGCPVCALKRALALSGQGSEAQVVERAGDQIGRYKLIEKIGEGGYGVVYMAEQAEPIRRRVALKVVKLGMDTKQVIARFEAERQALALMDHPNIARIFDAGITGAPSSQLSTPNSQLHFGRPYFVMELVRGVKITEYCDQHNLPTIERLDLFMQVCHAVQHAHQKGVIHRDIKPSNVLVTLSDGAPVPKVIDFGIAKATQQPLTDKTLLTGFHQFIGTPAYMSPEQAEMGPQDIDTRSDIYTLGVLLYELLTGRLPFEQKQLLEAGLDEMRRLIRENEPPRPSTRLSTLAHGDLAAIARSRQTEPPRLLNLVRGDLDWIVMKCLEKDRARRYETASGLAQDVLRHLSNEPVTAAAPSVVYRTGKFIRRHRFGLATATALALLLIAGVTALAVARGSLIERDAARQVTALRSAELAARSGQWRQALKQWYQAEAGGYNDQVYLGLQRAEAWTVLSEPVRAEVEIRRLAKRSDLGNQTGAVLLRLGEYELFDVKTANQGVAHVREAMQAGLAPADRALAQGLIADSTPRALELFRQALQLNPYCHSAHRHSLGLEFLLGQHREFREHVRLFRVLYPDDATPRFLEAAVLSINGNLVDAQALLESLRGSCNPQVHQQLRAGLRAFATASSAFSLGTILATNRLPMSPLELFAAQGTAFGFAGYDVGQSPLRIPQLPCVRQGLLAGNEALRQLAIPFIGNPRAAADQIKASWEHHPEALVPALAGFLLDQRGPGSASLLQLQTELFQLAADSPSLLPNLPRLCRFLAARNQWELAASPSPAPGAREACVRNVNRASLSGELTAPECRAFFGLAMDLEQLEVARAFLHRWEGLDRADPAVVRARIRLDLVAGAFGNALQELNQVLAQNPGDPWAKSQRELALGEIRALAAFTLENAKPKP
jgi:serine/threonine protein kinase